MVAAVIGRHIQKALSLGNISKIQFIQTFRAERGTDE